MLFTKIFIVYAYIGLLIFGFFYFNDLFRSMIKRESYIEFLKKNPAIPYEKKEADGEWEIEVDLSEQQLEEIKKVEKAIIFNLFVLMVFVWPIFLKLLKTTLFPGKQ